MTREINCVIEQRIYDENHTIYSKSFTIHAPAINCARFCIVGVDGGGGVGGDGGVGYKYSIILHCSHTIETNARLQQRCGYKFRTVSFAIHCAILHDFYRHDPLAHKHRKEIG